MNEEILISIGFVIMGVVGGIIFGFLFTRIIHKIVVSRRAKRISKRLETQDNIFVLDGKKYDLAADIKRQQDPNYVKPTKHKVEEASVPVIKKKRGRPKKK